MDAKSPRGDSTGRPRHAVTVLDSNVYTRSARGVQEGNQKSYLFGTYGSLRAEEGVHWRTPALGCGGKIPSRQSAERQRYN